MGRQPQPGGLKHIHFDRCNWRVQDKTNQIDHRGFATQYDAWIWRQAERARRALPLIDDAKPEWFDRSGDKLEIMRDIVREYKKIRDAVVTGRSIDPPTLVEYNGLDALINTGYQAVDTHAQRLDALADAIVAKRASVRRMLADPFPLPAPSIAIADHTVAIPEALTVASRNQLVIADLHCPYHSGRALETALNTARQRFGDAFDIVIAGDLFDFAELSRHPKDEREDATEVVFSTTGYVLRKIAEWAPGKVYILPGNHDRRMARKTGIPLQIDDLLAVAFKPQGIPINVKWTNNDYLIIGHTSPARRWLIGHPRNYSQQGGFTAARLAQIRQINVITAHDHTVGQQMSVDGRWRGISCGHMTRPDAHAYKRASLSIHREWSAGFVLLADGVAECHTLDSV